MFGSLVNADSQAFTFSGAPAAREIWTVTLDDSSNTSFAYEVLEGDGLVEVAAGLAKLINTLASDFIATSEGSTLVFVRTVGSGIDSGFAVTAANADTGSLYDVDGATADSIAINIDGIPLDGEVWTVILDGKHFVYTVEGEATLSAVMDGLAVQINLDGDYAATTELDTLVVTKKVGLVDFTANADFIITPPTLSVTVPEVSETVQVVTDQFVGAAKLKFVGSVNIDDVWSLSVDALVYHHTVVGGDSLESLLDFFATAIANDGSADNYTATVEGDTLVVINRTSTTAVTMDLDVILQPVFTLGGIPAVVEVWKIWLDDSTPFTYTVSDSSGSLDTLTDIAAELVVAINLDVHGRYLATSSGENITVTPATEGHVFTIYQDPEVTPAGTTNGRIDVKQGRHLDNSSAFARMMDIGAYGTPVAGDVWALLLAVDEAYSVHSYTVSDTGGLDTAVDIANRLAADINANADLQFTATTEDSMLIIVHRLGAEFTMDNVYTVNANTTTTKVQLNGVPVTGEVWTIILDDSESLTTISHVVTTGQSAGDVAASLAFAINQRAPASFIASTTARRSGTG